MQFGKDALQMRAYRLFTNMQLVRNVLRSVALCNHCCNLQFPSGQLRNDLSGSCARLIGLVTLDDCEGEAAEIEAGDLIGMRCVLIVAANNLKGTLIDDEVR